MARAARRAQRLAQYERARALREEGDTWAIVAQQVGVAQRTLRYWCAREGFPERRRRTGDRSTLAPYRAYLRQRWEAGERSATQLWHAVRAQGFRGGYRSGARVLAPWRQRKLGRTRGATTAAAPAPPAPPALPARQIAYSLLRRPDKRTEAEQSQLLQVQQADPCLTTLATHTEAFAQMVRARAAERLESWLEGVLASPWRELKRSLNLSLRHEVARLIVWHAVSTRPVVPSTVSYEDVREGNAPYRALGHGTHSLPTGTGTARGRCLCQHQGEMGLDGGYGEQM